MIVLGIESAIGSGSLAVGDGSSMHRSQGPEMAVSRAEDLIPNIETLLDQANISKHSLELIAVSRGPGSFTGIRIGIATAIGLARALKIKCVGLSMFDAITDHYSIEPGSVIALPFGKSDLAWKRFLKNGGSIESATGFNELVDYINEARPDHVYGLADIESRLNAANCYVSFRTIEPALAEILIQQAPNQLASSDLSPIYLQNSQRASLLF